MSNALKLRLKTIMAALGMVLILGSTVRAMEIRDVVDVRGVRAHHLVGYGLVVGLKGTGDSSRATGKALRRFLARAGMTIEPGELASRNAALVVLTADLAPFAAKGQRFDCSVSAIGDATSLVGGRLIGTPLHGADPTVAYARVQGTIGFSGQENPKQATSGTLRGAAIVEREVPLQFIKDGVFRLALRRADPVLAQSVADAIAQGLRAKPGQTLPARAVNTGLIEVRVPKRSKDDPVAFLSQILQFPLDFQPPARIVINQRTGTVVVNEAVRVLPVAFAHEGLAIRIADSSDEKGATGHTVALESGVTLKQLVDQLNRVGISPRDLIAVIEQLIKAGVLHAELVVE